MEVGDYLMTKSKFKYENVPTDLYTNKLYKIKDITKDYVISFHGIDTRFYSPDYPYEIVDYDWCRLYGYFCTITEMRKHKLKTIL